MEDDIKRIRRRREEIRRRQLLRQKRKLAVTVVLSLVIILVLFLNARSSDDKKKTPAIFKSNAEDNVTPDREKLEPPDNPNWITQDLLPINKYSRPGDELAYVNGIVVHYVGNSSTTAEGNRSYFASLAETGDTYASSHFVIGIDGTIIQCVPLDEISYCSNERNLDTIAIECCHPDETGEFTDATYESLVKLTNWLSTYYSLSKNDIIRHYDITGKECPRNFVYDESAWLKFKEDLLID